MNRPLEVGRLRYRLSSRAFQPVAHRTEAVQFELDALVVVIVNLVVDTRFQHLDGFDRFEMKVFSFQSAQEALEHRIVIAVALAAHALRHCATCKHRAVGSHLDLDRVVPALIRCTVRSQVGLDRESAASSVPETSLNTGRLAMRSAMDFPVVQVQADRQIELVTMHVELGDICHPLLVDRLGH